MDVFAWFGTISGVLIGIAAKWGIDVWTEGRRHDREDRLRYLADKKQVYAEFLSACHDLADVREELRDLKADGQALDANAQATSEDVDRFNARSDALEERWQGCFRRLNDAIAVLDLLAPPEVARAAHALASCALRPHGLQRRVLAEDAFVEKARADLGSGDRGTIPGWQYEPFDDEEAEEWLRKRTRPNSGQAAGASAK